jgi:hypothetical protein
MASTSTPDNSAVRMGDPHLQTPSEILVKLISDLGINALAADDCIALIELGPRGPEIFHELSDATAEPEGSAEAVAWLFVDVTCRAQAEAVAITFAELLPRYPELRRAPRKDRLS